MINNESIIPILLSTFVCDPTKVRNYGVWQARLGMHDSVFTADQEDWCFALSWKGARVHKMA